MLLHFKSTVHVPSVLRAFHNAGRQTKGSRPVKKLPQQYIEAICKNYKTTGWLRWLWEMAVTIQLTWKVHTMFKSISTRFSGTFLFLLLITFFFIFFTWWLFFTLVTLKCVVWNIIQPNNSLYTPHHLNCNKIKLTNVLKVHCNISKTNANYFTRI